MPKRTRSRNASGTLRAGRIARTAKDRRCEPQFGDRHAVLGQRAGLVRAEHGRGAERLDGRRAPVRTRAWEMRHAPIAMNTVSTTGNSSGSIDMPSAMPASKRVEPAAAQRSVQHHHQHADRPAGQRKDARPAAASAPAAAAVRSPACSSDWPILPISLRGASRGDFGKARAPHDQRCRRRRSADRRRPDGRLPAAAAPCARRLRTGTDFARQQRFVGLQIAGLPAASRRPARGRLRQARSDRRAPPRGRRCALRAPSRIPARAGWSGRAAPPERARCALLQHGDHYRHGAKASRISASCRSPSSR